MQDLSIIILSYNTKEITQRCLNSLHKTLLSRTSKITYEIIIIDNGSSDGSGDMLLQWKESNMNFSHPIQVVLNKKNTGFPKGNNQGFLISNGRYILFSNSDIIWNDLSFENLIAHLDRNKDIGALTVKVVLPNGKIDPASHRGFPTIWNAFTYFFKLERIFGSIPLIGRAFGGYHLTYLDLSAIHEIDSPTGAFYLTRREILQRVGGFDEQFFMYGEDLDLSFRIKELGYKIIYYPLYSVTHLKYASGLKTKDGRIKTLTKKYFFDAMVIFYRKHYEKHNLFIVNKFVYSIIHLKNILS
ncbi:glycosyl transferase family 2 [Candidatus Roizmanbacteria bacterium CG09_land_8_20_14_0_10_41_9]|uniref:Glycosyl transferase family 2 n=1 Tax=Candidatus Roizmanbacteria bacterium CG09_land_8_20_14_0_10_41_9 TaxID=1974850 RepID=A0A2H0WS51_9BACT|nr:MAG: glycosyl transferase family 2 [Candidatus Roizmanbacteria bacterium CG09_land_8_20_14_0_10_41_9]